MLGFVSDMWRLWIRGFVYCVSGKHCLYDVDDECDAKDDGD